MRRILEHMGIELRRIYPDAYFEITEGAFGKRVFVVVDNIATHVASFDKVDLMTRPCDIILAQHISDWLHELKPIKKKMMMDRILRNV